LQKYLLILLKSYEYFALEPFNAFDLNLSDLTVRLTEFLDRSSADEMPDLDDVVADLQLIFEGISASIGERVVDRLTSGMQRSHNSTAVEFSAEQIATLNQNRRLRFNIADMGYRLPRSDCRIEVLSEWETDVPFTIKHEGESFIEKSGNVFAFVSRSDKEKLRWLSTYNPATGEIHEDAPDRVEEELFRRLFGAGPVNGSGDPAGEYRSTISHMAPGLYSDFQIRFAPSREDAQVSIQALTLEIDYVAEPD